MTSKVEALADIADIAYRHDLTIEDIAKVLSVETESNPQEKTSSVLAKVLAFLGSIFVLAGIALFIDMLWDDFNSVTRVLVTLGVGFSLYLFGLATMCDERFSKVTTPLLFVSGLLQPIGIVVMMDEYSRGGQPEHGLLFMCTVMFLQQFLTFMAKRDYGVLLFMSLFFGAAGFGTFCDIIGMDESLIALAVGIGLMCISYLIDKSVHQKITPPWYFVGSIFFLYGIFDLIDNTVLEILFFGVASGLMYLATLVRSRTLLFVSVLAIMSFTGYYFQGVLFNAFGLIIMGFLLIGLSVFAMKLNRKYIEG